ncbi:MAG: aspartate/glutamate racemase family protein [Patescibacteria group bacterium]
MKTIGIIGGFGPEATAKFYLELIQACRRAGLTHQPHVIVWNVPVPRKLERDALVHGNNLDQFVPLLTAAARGLEQAGANIVVLPCNTLHIHEEVIRSSVTVPFVSIITATAQFLRRRNMSRVGFLGSRITVRENLFKKKAKDITFITVAATLQQQIDKGLDQFVGDQNNILLKEALKKSFSFLTKKDVRDTLLACTDFHNLCPNLPNMRVHDTLDILVRATLDMV